MVLYHCLIFKSTVLYMVQSYYNHNVILRKNEGDMNMGDKKLMYCLKCGHEFLSTVGLPRCSKCNSTRVINHKEVSSKKDVMNLKLRMDQLEKEFTELEGVVNGNRDLIREIVKIIKEGE